MQNKTDQDALIQESLLRHTLAPEKAEHAEALQAVKQGNPDEAIRILYKLFSDNPYDSRIPADLLRILILEHRFQEAEHLALELPAALLKDTQLNMLCTHVELIAASTPPEKNIPKLIMNYYMSLDENPDQVEKRLKLASILLKIDDIESALEQLYAIRQFDRAFRNDIGHRGMLALLGMLEDNAEMVSKYRSRIT